MAKKVVEWNIDLDESIERIGLIVNEKEPAIGVEARFASQGDDDVFMFEDEDMYFNYMMAFEEESYTFQVDDEVFADLRAENSIIAPALIPLKLIKRIEDNGDEFHGYFTREAVKNAAYSFQKYKLTDQFNINHGPELVSGVFVAESWIVSDENDKSRRYGFNLPIGSWMTILKFSNDALYNEYVASGKLNGLSIETQLVERIVFNKVIDSKKEGE